MHPTSIESGLHIAKTTTSVGLRVYIHVYLYVYALFVWLWLWLCMHVLSGMPAYKLTSAVRGARHVSFLMAAAVLPLMSIYAGNLRYDARHILYTDMDIMWWRKARVFDCYLAPLAAPESPNDSPAPTVKASVAEMSTGRTALGFPSSRQLGAECCIIWHIV